MKIGIIGAGLIGNKRAAVLKDNKNDSLLAIADVDKERAKKLAEQFEKCQAYDDWKNIIRNKDIEAVIVATTHNHLAEISLAALQSGKHVLCEKPLGIKVSEVEKCVAEAKRNHLAYKCGFNHRFHSAVLKAFTLFTAGKVGKLMYIKATYGIGGRPGYEKEWRMNKKISGGGELIDQGTHLLDLARWFMGEPTKIQAELRTCFWPVRVEDNVFIQLENKLGIAQLHASWTEWKNRFVFEVYGIIGYLKINGLGGSYGTETLTWGLRVPGQAPKEKVWTFTGPDKSWTKEWTNFKQAISGKAQLLGSGEDGLAVLKIIKCMYGKEF